jgi:hypothetical protein
MSRLPVLVTALLLLQGITLAQTPYERLEKGIYEQETAGDLNAAIAIYAGIVEGGEGDAATRAEATYRLGQCQLLSGKIEAAKASFAALIERYPEQRGQLSKILNHLQQTELSMSPPAVYPAFAGNKNYFPENPLQQKLAQIVVPKLTFEETDIETVLAYLRQRSKELDVDGEGVNFLLHLEGSDVPRVTVDFDNIPLGEVVRYISQGAGLQYRVDGHAVVFGKQGALLGPLETRFYPSSGSLLQAANSFGDELEGDAAIIAFFESMGVIFPEGSKLRSLAGVNRLIITHTPEELRKIERIMQELIVQPVQVRVSTELQVVDDPRLAEVDSGAIDRRLLDQVPAEKRQRYAQLSAVTLNGSTCQTIYEGVGLNVQMQATPIVDADGVTIQLDFSWQCNFAVENPGHINTLTMETALMLWDGEAIALRIPAEQAQTCILLVSATLLNPAGQAMRTERN